MAKRKTKHEKLVRCFEVSEPTLHSKGHTVYKIIQKLIPVDSPEKEVQQIIVWRRYNDIKKLYKAMLKLHTALYRKEEFPPFAQAKLFGRFDKDVIVERQRCAQDLLNFIAQRSYFVKSKAFQEFFEGGECSTVADSSEILKPIRAGEVSEEACVGSSQDSDLDSLPTEAATADWVLTGNNDWVNEDVLEAELNLDSAAGLGGVWQYRQAVDNISLGGVDDDDDDNTDFTDDSALSTPLPGAEAAFFDPFHPLSTNNQESTLKTTNCGSNEWLLSTMEKCGITPGEEGTPTSTGTPDPSIILESDGPETETIPDLPNIPTDDIEPPASFYLDAPTEKTTTHEQSKIDSSHSVEDRSNDTVDGSIAGGVQYGKGDLEFDPLRSVNGSSILGQISSDSSDKKASLAVPEKPLHKNLSLLNLDVQDKGDYIFQAANQISLGQQCEASENYHMAFNYIRNGVGILLTGVQLDENSARREVVRRKTAKYLQRAEKLHKKYLDGQGNQNLADRWDKGQVSPTKLLDPQAACIEGPLSELKNYKVIGVIDRVMLVIDSVTDKTYVLKVVQKSSSLNSPKKKNVVPTYCPCMVKLHRFYETKYAIILVLQHAPGGTLWKYIGHQNNTSQSEMNELYLQGTEGTLQYAGRPVQNKNTVKTTENENAPNPNSVPAVNTLTQHNKCTAQTDQSNNEVEISLDQNTAKVAYKADTDSVNSENVSDITFENYHYTNRQNKINSNSNCNSEANHVDKSDINAPKHCGPGGNSHLSQVDTAEPVLLGQGPSQFQDLLKSTSAKPTLESFSVNSFDSDSGPASRFESVNSDHIESIQEVSESASPVSSPKRVSKRKSNDSETVFGEETGLDNAGWKREKSRERNGTMGTSFVSETDRMLAEIDKDLADSDRVFSSLLDNEGTPISGAVIHGHSTPRSKPVLNAVTEQSIYDYRSPDSSLDSGSADLAGVEALDNDDLEVENINTLSGGGSDAELNADEINIKHSSSGCVSVKKSNSVFRQVSQERSLETDNKPRNRSASGLSSVFDNLDMVSEDKCAAITLPENMIRQWAAQIVTALEHLHELGIFCRDLSPENVLLGESGDVLLTYFCQWAHVERGVSQCAMQHFYTAPEVVGKAKYSSACDWWSLGVLLFELFTGKRLSSVFPYSITSHTQLDIPGDLSTEAQSLLSELLKYNPSERLGAGGGGVEEIKSHPFFENINWDNIGRQKNSCM